MAAKEIESTCPCCDARLVVDVRTGKVLRWSSGEGSGKRAEDLDELSRRVGERSKDARDRFDESVAREKGKEGYLDELFRRASEKLVEGEGEDEARRG